MSTSSHNGAHIESVNIGRPREVLYRRRAVRTSIWKSPVAGRVAVRGVNIEGDDQADRGVHGGPDKAVYAYAREDLDWWAGRLDRPLDAGAFGENLTVVGMPVGGAVVGERWRVGSALLEVAQPRLPCFKLGIRMGSPHFPRRFAAAGRPGAYFRIVEEGDLAAGDSIEVVHRPEHGITMETVSRVILHDHSRASELLEAPELPTKWHEWAREHSTY